MSHECHGISNHWQPNCLVNNLLRMTIKKTSKLHITSPLWVEPTCDWWIPLTKGQLCGKHFHVKTSSWDSSRQNDNQQPLSLQICCPDKLLTKKSMLTNFYQHRMAVLGAKELNKTTVKYMRWLNFLHANIWQKWIPYTTQIQHWLFMFNYAMKEGFQLLHNFSIEKSQKLHIWMTLCKTVVSPMC